LCASSFAIGQQKTKPDLDNEFKSAVAAYDAGNLSQAAAQLEKLLPSVPRSFEVHELLGQTYASQGESGKAIEQLEQAVNLKPNSGPARTNLAATLLHAGKTELAGKEFRKALELEPNDYDAAHNMGEFYIASGKLADALPQLERAQAIRPSYDNGYDLAQAQLLTGNIAAAKQTALAVLKIKDTGEMHSLLGQIEEKSGDFVAAANELQTAAHMDPSDDNLFDWGSELLLHRTYDPAIEVFRQATLQYPNSPRLKIGLGMSLYSRGKYDDAVKALLAAADLNPSDPRCYSFLSKAYDSSPNQAEEVIATFKRFADLQPNNAAAQYYYAMSLWKGKRSEDATIDLTAIEGLLQKAIALDDRFADPQLQLGNLYADQHQYAKSEPFYQRAIELDANLSDAHYRLGQDYVHTGQKERAQKEFETYQKLRAQHLAEVDKARTEVRQFVVEEKAASSNKP
jgi:tetratricopeptide (TPR) repeat protein